MQSRLAPFAQSEFNAVVHVGQLRPRTNYLWEALNLWKGVEWAVKWFTEELSPPREE